MYLLSVSVIAAASIGYELLLMRLMSIIQWHHFAYMIISLALLGFGASGTFLILAKQWLLQRQRFSLWSLAIFFSISSILCFYLVQKIPFNPLEVPWSGLQFIYLSINYLLLMIPFFCSATYVGLVFIIFSNKLEKVYSFDLIGSGVGVLVIVYSLFVLEPQNCLRVIFFMGFVACAFNTPINRYKFLASLLTIFLGAMIAYGIPTNWTALNLSEYKSLNKILQIPDNKIIREVSSPRGLITVVKTGRIPLRYSPGLSLKNPYKLPEQLALFTDGDSLSAINRFNYDISEIGHMDYVTSALAYHLVKSPKVLISGLSGGENILRALYFNSEKIDVVETNPQIVELLKKEYNNFSGNIYDLPTIKIYVGNLRNFLIKTKNLYNVIFIPPENSSAMSSVGFESVNVSNLFTVEAIKVYLDKLKTNGILSITSWIKIPPRNSLKLFATIIHSLNKENFDFSEKNVMMIRSWKTTTLIIKNGLITEKDINTLKLFCQNRSFDLVYYPGIKQNEVNRYNLLEKPFFYEGTSQLLSNDRSNFIKNYKFNIEPSIDSRPFFYSFFKWSSLPELLKLRTHGTVSMIEWGYIILIATLLIALIFSLLFILIPIVAFKKLKQSYPKKSIMSYFFLVGLAFMFLEIMFIQRFILFLGYPFYAIAYVIIILLLFAGIGSSISKKIEVYLQKIKSSIHAIDISIICLSTLLIIYLFFLTPIFNVFFSSNEIIKFLISVLLIAPYAFFMGMPFPLGLAWLEKHFKEGIPWAWGINGCASVIGAVFASLLLMSLEYTTVTGIAVFMYLATLTIFRFVFLKKS